MGVRTSRCQNKELLKSVRALMIVKNKETVRICAGSKLDQEAT